LLIKNSTGQNDFQFHSTGIAIQQKSNEDSFSKLNKLYKKKISKGKKHEEKTTTGKIIHIWEKN
jgi:hypothetical protein